MVLSWIGILLLAAGALIMVLGSIGLLRLPDFYARTHAAATVDTLGVFLFVLGLAVREGASWNTLKLVAVACFILVANPAGTHALAQSAFLGRTPPNDEDEDGDADTDAGAAEGGRAP